MNHIGLLITVMNNEQVLKHHGKPIAIFKLRNLASPSLQKTRENVFSIKKHERMFSP